MKPVSIVVHPEQQIRELGRDITHAAYLRGDFVLSSGVHSSYYFDKYLFVTKPAILRRLATFLGERVPAGTDRLAGPGPGGVALAAAVGLEIGVPFVVTNDSAHGEPPVIGEIHSGDRVTLIEDVLASGARALEATRAIVATGAEVVLILAVLDREEGALERIGRSGYRAHALYKSSDLGIRPGV